MRLTRLLCAAMVLVFAAVSVRAQVTDAQHSQPVVVIGTIVTRTDKSGTITTGGVAQTAIGLNLARKGCLIQNQSTGDLWISELTTAVATSPSLWLPSGTYFTCETTGVPTTLISIIGITTGQAYAAREW